MIFPISLLPPPSQLDGLFFIITVLYVHNYMCICVQGQLFVLNNPLGGSSPEGANSPTLSSNKSPEVLCQGWEPVKFPTSSFVPVLFSQPYCWSIMGATSLSPLGDTLSQKTSSFLSLRCWNCVVDLFIWDWAPRDPLISYHSRHNLLWFLVMVSVCCKEMSLWWGSRPILICGYKDAF